MDTKINKNIFFRIYCLTVFIELLASIDPNTMGQSCLDILDVFTIQNYRTFSTVKHNLRMKYFFFNL